MALSPGTRLGPYEIQSAIGAGGMGEVYKARDTRLDRTVAIKILPKPSRPIRNFVIGSTAKRAPSHSSTIRTSARCTTSASMPAPRFSSWSFSTGKRSRPMRTRHGQGIRPAAGRSAADRDPDRRRAGRGPPPGDRPSRPETWQYLPRPEQRGLRPADRQAARFRPRENRAGPEPSTAATMLPTTPPQPITAQGTILGTFQYMAPEQLEGAEADARTDIFAFGCVLYEMFAGKKAFEGKTQTNLVRRDSRARPAAAHHRAAARAPTRRLHRPQVPGEKPGRPLADRVRFGIGPALGRGRREHDPRPNRNPLERRERERAASIRRPSGAGILGSVAIGLDGGRYLATVPAPPRRSGLKCSRRQT